MTQILLPSSYYQSPLPSLWYDVREYGAKGDGTTDDTAALQAALDAAATSGGIKPVYMPPSHTYAISSPLVLKALSLGNPLVLVGDTAITPSIKWIGRNSVTGTATGGTATSLVDTTKDFGALGIAPGDVVLLTANSINGEVDVGTVTAVSGDTLTVVGFNDLGGAQNGTSYIVGPPMITVPRDASLGGTPNKTSSTSDQHFVIGGFRLLGGSTGGDTGAAVGLNLEGLGNSRVSNIRIESIRAIGVRTVLNVGNLYDTITIENGGIFSGSVGIMGAATVSLGAGNLSTWLKCRVAGCTRGILEILTSTHVFQSCDIPTGGSVLHGIELVGAESVSVQGCWFEGVQNDTSGRALYVRNYTGKNTGRAIHVTGCSFSTGARTPIKIENSDAVILANEFPSVTATTVVEWVDTAPAGEAFSCILDIENSKHTVPLDDVIQLGKGGGATRMIAGQLGVNADPASSPARTFRLNGIARFERGGGSPPMIELHDLITGQTWEINVGSSGNLGFKHSSAAGTPTPFTIENNAPTDVARINGAGGFEIRGALNHVGSTVGFFGATPVTKPAAYTPTNVTTDRSYDADATTTAELADVLGTLIADLQSLGLIG